MQLGPVGRGTLPRRATTSVDKQSTPNTFILSTVLPRSLFRVAGNAGPRLYVARALATSSAGDQKTTSEQKAAPIDPRPVDHHPFPFPDTTPTWNQVLDKMSRSLLMTEMVRGMWVVLENFFRPPYTIFYPNEKGVLSPRFRGEHALRRYPSGELAFLNGE